MSFVLFRVVSWIVCFLGLNDPRTHTKKRKALSTELSSSFLLARIRRIQLTFEADVNLFVGI